MKKNFRKQLRNKNRLKRRLVLGFEQLEDRRLLVNGSSIVTAIGNYVGGHTFTITEPATLSGVINIPAGTQAYTFSFKGNITNAGGDFPAGKHATTSLVVIGASQPTEFNSQPITAMPDVEPEKFTNSRMKFSGLIEVPPGENRITFKAKRSLGVIRQRDIDDAQITTVVNRTPVARNASRSTNEDIDLVGQVSGTDDDSADSLVFSALTNPVNGELLTGMASNGSFTYRPKLDFNGTDSFTFRANDGNASAVGTVVLTINPVNDAPRFASALAVTVAQAGTVNIDTAQGAVDPENDAVDRSTIVISTQPSSGTAVLRIVDGIQVISYSPGPTFQGLDTLQYTVADVNGARSLPRTVVLGIVDRPVITTLDDDVLPGTGSFSFPVFTNDLQPVFSGTSEPGASVRLLPILIFGGATVTANASGVWQIALSSPLPTSSTQSVTAEATSGGVVITSEPVFVSLDTTAPIASSSLKSELRGTSLSEDIAIRFTDRNAVSDPVVGFGLEDLSLTVSGNASNLISGSAATLQPNTPGNFADAFTLKGLASVTDKSGTYTLRLNAGSSSIADRASNLLSTNLTTSLAIDKDAFKLSSFVLNTAVVGGSKLPVQVVPSTSVNGASVSYATTISDQQFAGFPNAVSAQILSVKGSVKTRLGTMISIPIASSSQDKLNFTPTTVNLVADLPIGQSELQVELTDVAGNSFTSASFFVFVSGNASETVDARGTPVDSTTYFLGARLTADAVKGSNKIIVNQDVRVGTTVRILDEATSKIENFVVDDKVGSGPYELTLRSLLKDNPPLANSYPKATTTISWLRPWTMAFDKTTQTTWFSNEDGNYLGQFDPATGEVKLFDVVLPEDLPAPPETVLPGTAVRETATFAERKAT